METFLIFFLFALGIVLVIKGGDWFVDAASWIAEVSGIPKLIIGATIVSLATTLPEMLVSVMAALRGSVDMAIGNAVGSVTANIGMIMAISVMFMPGAIRRRDYLLKSVLMLLASLMIVIAGFNGEVNFVFSIILFVIFFVFMWENITAARRTMAEGNQEKEEKPKLEKKEVGTNIFKFIIGAVMIVVGADLLVDNGSEIARMFGISERVIGVTLVAIGTSLPELITTITAITKKESSLSVGNILGANIIDLTLILPLCNVLSGKSIPVSVQSASVDLVACLLVGCIAVIPAMFKEKFARWQGYALLAVYIVYIIITSFVL